MSTQESTPAAVTYDFLSADMTETITYQQSRYLDEPELRDMWTLDIDGQQVAELVVEISTGMIVWVGTDKAHRGNGYAARLFETASQQRNIYHAPQAFRSSEGDCFAWAVGGYSLDADELSPEFAALYPHDEESVLI